MSTNTQDLATLANAIRALSMDAVEQAKSGHPGMPMGMADAATVLFARHLKFDPAQPDWADRDRFILSAGHGSMLLYSLLYLTGYPEMTIDEIKNFRQLGSKTPGHPEYGHTIGVETTTGPLGQGLANAVGMALAERHMNARFGDDLVDHYTYVIAGDGCLMEGISHEAASLAGHLGLGRMIVLFDDNGISIDGPTSLAVSDDQVKRFEALGWHVQSVDGHKQLEINDAIKAAKADPRPSLIACKTTIGYGAPNKAGTAGSHGAPLGAEEIAATREALGWSAGPFEIPKDVLDAWRALGRRGASDYDDWLGRYEDQSEEVRREFDRVMAGELRATDISDALHSLKADLASDPPKIASRVASQKAIAAFAPALPEMIGGSADLTGSNNTKTNDLEVLTRDNPGGRYLHYGVREHAMVAAMNGMALHGGVVPFGGTFLVFTDYCRPSIRLAALMGIRVVLVMTHDSIGLGEDGPTHQPVEHLAALRAIPNLAVMRPADAIETAECWQIALENTSGPTVLALSRQGLPGVRTHHAGENRSRRGGYVLSEPKDKRAVTLVATGSEVDVIRRAKQLLEKDGISAAVVSMPCMETFLAQDAGYRAQVLGDAPVVAVEAGLQQGWEPLLGANGAFVGMTGFGASAPAGALFEHFGITPEGVAEAARGLVG